jgi:hypothetical protein
VCRTCQPLVEPAQVAGVCMCGCGVYTHACREVVLGPVNQVALVGSGCAQHC